MGPGLTPLAQVPPNHSRQQAGNNKFSKSGLFLCCPIYEAEPERQPQREARGEQKSPPPSAELKVSSRSGKQGAKHWNSKMQS